MAKLEFKSGLLDSKVLAFLLNCPCLIWQSWKERKSVILLFFKKHLSAVLSSKPSRTPGNLSFTLLFPSHSHSINTHIQRCIHTYTHSLWTMICVHNLSFPSLNVPFKLLALWYNSLRFFFPTGCHGQCKLLTLIKFVANSPLIIFNKLYNIAPNWFIQVISNYSPTIHSNYSNLIRSSLYPCPVSQILRMVIIYQVLY